MIEALDKLGEEGAPGRLLLSKVLPVAEKLAAALREHPACERVDGRRARRAGWPRPARTST